MIIIDKPYISKELKEYLNASQLPVLKSDISIKENAGYSLNLVDESSFAELYSENTRLYTLSENSIDWIKNNIKDENLIKCIDTMKDKFKFREKISSLYPSFYFKKASIDELEQLKINQSEFPLVLKPVVGFFSAGVYLLKDDSDFKNAVEDIKKTYGQWKEVFPASVIGENEFILEQYIEGEEYAIDAYYDENGKAVVLNILAHEFLSSADVKDVLYYTSKELLLKYTNKIENYLSELNTIFNIKNFPFHVELRIDENNEIAPIEFNPLRFAGWSTTDITKFAFDFHTYDYFLNNKRPDWQKLLKGKDDKQYNLIVLTKPESYSEGDVLNFKMLKNEFSTVLCLRELDYARQENPFGFIFTETKGADLEEITKIITPDLSRYIM